MYVRVRVRTRACVCARVRACMHVCLSMIERSTKLVSINYMS